MTTNNTKRSPDDVQNDNWRDNLLAYATAVAIVAWLALVGWAGVSAIRQSIKKHRSSPAVKEVLRPSGATKNAVKSVSYFAALKQLHNAKSR